VRSPRRRCALAALFALTAAFSAFPASAQNHPFGSHPFAYASGAILPDHVGAANRDQAVRDFYDAWKARYLRQTCGSGRYVVVTKVTRGNLTVSEGHGYGMILAALMAGHDPQARALFDGMYAHFRQHPTATHTHLMSWNQNGACKDVEGNDSASDGDLDIAYALLLADKQWGSCGAIDYRGEALAMVADIASGELDASGRYVLLGDWVVPSDTQYYPATRTSDFMPDHYRSFADAAGGGPWSGLLDRTYQIVDALQTNHSASAGLFPDFAVDPLGAPAPAPADFLEGANDGAYDYNACRDPWRLGTDFIVSGDARAHTAVQRINSWIRGVTGGAPSAIRSGYQLSGSMSAGADYLSMAFVAPLGVGAMVDAANQAWLNAVWDLAVATPITSEGYYENTLKLLAMIVMSGNWWPPEGVSGGCSPVTTTICTNPGYLTKLQIKFSSLLSGPGRQGLSLKGSVFFPAGNPVAPPFTDGAQLLVEDLGSGASALFEVSHRNVAVPPRAAGVCAPTREGWQVKTSSTLYRNRSTALDPPACTLGTARGLYSLKYRPRSSRDLDLAAKVHHSTIVAPVGPVRATLVFGDIAAFGDAGRCAVSAPLPCTSSPSGSRVRCR